MTNVFVFVPAYRRQVSAETFETSHRLMSTFIQRGIHCNIATYSWFDIAELRNSVLSWWYDVLKNSTHLLFIDDDMGFEPQLVMDMLAFGEPVVGAMYPKRTLPLQWAGSGLEKPEVRGPFMEVEGIGAGCLLIRRDAVDLMIEKYPDMVHPTMLIAQMAAQGGKRTLTFFDQWRNEQGKIAEDIAFCRRYREAGGRVWACVGHPVTHVGLHEFTGCLAEKHNKNAATSQPSQEAAE